MGVVRMRLMNVKTLYEILPKGTEGGKEFARIIDLLLFHEARRTGRNITIFDDSSGDYHGLDSFTGKMRRDGATGYQYKFYPSPLKDEHRQEIIQALKKAKDLPRGFKLKKWILVTPEDLKESATRKDGGDVTWFNCLREKLGLKFEIEHWGHTKLLSLFLSTPALCLFYYPEIVENGSRRAKTIEDTRSRYNESLPILYRDIQFVGMSVYKPEATRGIPMEHIYIPLRVLLEAQIEQSIDVYYRNPLSFLSPGSRYVILGDPGSGKSTLLRFLALVGISKPLQKRYNAQPDKRLPIFVTLRRYADELKTRTNLPIMDFIQESIQADFNLKDADATFFEYYLETGQTLFFFDGLDELPSPHFKQIIRERIRTLNATYPGNTILVTSRIVGYDSPFRFDRREFSHYYVAKLQLPEIEKFVKDWYRFRIENERERDANVKDLIRIFNDRNHTAILELAENPLLLTIIALVHRIDAVLPDERVVLYQKCTETLLNTWHTWKFRHEETKNRGKTERRNRHRVEAIAYWMHCQSGETRRNQRAVVPYDELKKFLSEHIADTETLNGINDDPEDLAENFLDFIKTRAGLLIELGDRQYSFVHLTFQEYLASSHLIAIGEKDGVAGIWRIIENRCEDPRWHEVIRLMIAGLKNDESQQFFIERLFSNKESSQSLVRSQLVGGLLLDGIEAAESNKEKITKDLLISSITTSDVEQFRSLTALLRALYSRDTADKKSIHIIFPSLLGDLVYEKQKIALTLVGALIETPKKELTELVQPMLASTERETLLYKTFFTEELKIEEIHSMEQSIQLFFTLQKYLLLLSLGGNYIATAYLGIANFLGMRETIKQMFYLQLISLGAEIDYGPLYVFLRNSFVMELSNYSGGENVFSQKKVKSLLEGHIARPFNHRLEMNLLPILVQSLNPKQKLGNYPKLEKMRKLVGDTSLCVELENMGQTQEGHLFKNNERETVVSFWKFTRNRVLRNLSKIAKKSYKEIKDIISDNNIDGIGRRGAYSGERWESAIVNPDFYSPFLSLLCITFDLEPRVQWTEALRIKLLPVIPKYINIHNQQVLERLEAMIAYGSIGDEEIYLSACYILMDTCGIVTGIDDLFNRDIFSRILVLTSRIDAAPLRIAHCIRGIALGNAPCVEDLKTMIASNEADYKAIFHACYWQ
jgi:energy-coupling factor transporter ATP-binding protein EcfA2